MTIYTLTSTVKNDRSETITGTLEDIRTRLLNEAFKWGWYISSTWKAWEDDSLEPEEDEIIVNPDLSTGSLKEFASDIWDMPAKHIRVEEEPNAMDLQSVSAFIAGKLKLDPKATEKIAEEYLAQAEQLDGTKINREALNQDDIDFLTETITYAQKAGDLGRGVVQQLEEVVQELDEASEQAKNLTKERDNLIFQALGEGVSVSELANLTKRTQSWIRQFRAKKAS
ncbi:hypothetical protein phi16_gp030 [Corynebacterium phage phi16]|uniref:hypothetical protein n=1 Tax=Corynebacterium glutamicum TaxID=1718 RepID=UPI00094453EE|nr:hypothetical protein [Corynebacterium glutamicum]APQ42533.1 hypothetical protein phi16_gp030 [Corynebacterium phage phi16]OKX80472.1 hypothetical protein AUO95_09960 [Corynebacterium glutamicum]